MVQHPARGLPGECPVGHQGDMKPISWGWGFSSVCPTVVSDACAQGPAGHAWWDTTPSISARKPKPTESCPVFNQGSTDPSKPPLLLLFVSGCPCSWSTQGPARCSSASSACTATGPARRSPTPADRPPSTASPSPRRKSASWPIPRSRAMRPACRAAW